MTMASIKSSFVPAAAQLGVLFHSMPAPTAAPKRMNSRREMTVMTPVLLIRVCRPIHPAFSTELPPANGCLPHSVGGTPYQPLDARRELSDHYMNEHHHPMGGLHLSEDAEKSVDKKG